MVCVQCSFPPIQVYYMISCKGDARHSLYANIERQYAESLVILMGCSSCQVLTFGVCYFQSFTETINPSKLPEIRWIVDRYLPNTECLVLPLYTHFSPVRCYALSTVHLKCICNILCSISTTETNIILHSKFHMM